MTGRLLLALLAFMASLTGQVAPAHARVGGVDAVGASIQPMRSESLTRVVAHSVIARATLPSARQDCNVIMAAPRHDCAPPVMLGIDRAHE